MTAADLTPEQRTVLRHALTSLISEESEERWAAGWYLGIEVKLSREPGPWHVLAEMLGEWPTPDPDSDCWEFRWVPLDEWKAAHP